MPVWVANEPLVREIFELFKDTNRQPVVQPCRLSAELVRRRRGLRTASSARAVGRERLILGAFHVVSSVTVSYTE
jgi:hypothetical protein